MEPFFQKSYKALVESPNGTAVWWHSLPLPDGNRVNGNNPDKSLQLKMWRAMQIADEGGLARKRVLDIGANDGFFSVAAVIAGARKVTAIDKDWSTWPLNIGYSTRAWQDAHPESTRSLARAILRTLEWMRTHSLESRVAFARRWLGQMLFAATDKPGPIMLARMVRRLREAGVADVDAIGAQMLREQQAINAAERSDAESGQRLPQVMKSARRAGLLEPDILAELGLSEHPLILATLRTQN